VQPVPRIAVVGRTITEVSTVWAGLQPCATSADLVVTEDVIDRALQAGASDASTVFMVLDQPSDLIELASMRSLPDWLAAVSTTELIQAYFPHLEDAAVRLLTLEDLSPAILQRSTRTASREYA
jgi:hypothetical protein